MHITYDVEALFDLQRNQNVLSCKNNSTMDTNCNDTEPDNRPYCVSPDYYHGCVKASFQGCISISSMSSSPNQSQIAPKSGSQNEHQVSCTNEDNNGEDPDSTSTFEQGISDTLIYLLKSN